MLNQLTLWDTPSAISLPALEDGELPAVLPAGPTTGKSGRPRARANRSRSPAKAPELLMHGTYGPTFSASSVPEGPLQSWENRLRQRLARIGSTECELTWKASPTPAGVLLSRLVPSTPRTVATGSGLLPTPSGTSNHGKNHVAGRLDEWGGSSNPFRGTPLGRVHSPAFEFWMMGYPAVWRQLMPPEIPSFRKLPRKSSQL